MPGEKKEILRYFLWAPRTWPGSPYWAWFIELSHSSLKMPIEKWVCEKIDTKQEVYLAQFCDSPR